MTNLKKAITQKNTIIHLQNNIGKTSRNLVLKPNIKIPIEESQKFIGKTRINLLTKKSNINKSSKNTKITYQKN